MRQAGRTYLEYTSEYVHTGAVVVVVDVAIVVVVVDMVVSTISVSVLEEV